MKDNPSGTGMENESPRGRTIPGRGTACRAPTDAATQSTTQPATDAEIQPSSSHHRKSIRLPGFDYSREGAYFITICTHDREELFGEIKNGEMILNENGKIARDIWYETPSHFPHIAMDEFVVMPNHIHGIIIINEPVMKNVGARHAVPLQKNQCEQFRKPTIGTIPTIIRSYKSAVTKKINENRTAVHTPVWKRNYWEHVIRDEKSYETIASYIINNPLKWEMDKLYSGVNNDPLRIRD